MILKIAKKTRKSTIGVQIVLEIFLKADESGYIDSQKNKILKNP